MTQAVNLANFANNLDTSGGMNPSAINAPVPVSKGGTAQTTLSAAVASFGNLLYPVGSVYVNMSDATNPATLLGFGTWSAIGSGRTIISAGGSYTAGSTGGSADAIVVSHSHTASSSTTATDSGHSHFYAGSVSTSSQFPVSGGGGYPGVGTPSMSGTNTNTASANISASTSTTVNSTGSSGTGANMTPYVAGYIWQRTA